MKTALMPMVLGLWLLAAGTGSWILLKYENSPGRSAATPQQWPAEARIPWPQTGPLMVMFAHPRCPCTRASIEELNRVMAHCKGRLSATVLFVQPSAMPDDWVSGTLWKSAAAIPGVSVQADRDGIESRRFGAETSGFTLLYAPDGQLMFKGGITAGRGHAGDSAGAGAIVSIVARTGTKVRQAPVFGCGLIDPCKVSAN